MDAAATQRAADFDRLYERLVLRGKQSQRKKKQQKKKEVAFRSSLSRSVAPQPPLPVRAPGSGPESPVADRAPVPTKRSKLSRPLSVALSSLNETEAPAELSPSARAAVARLRVARNLRRFSVACALRSPSRLAGEIATSPSRSRRLLQAYALFRRDRLRRLGPLKDRHPRRLGARMARVERIAARLFHRLEHDRDDSRGNDMRVLGDVLFFSPPAGQSMIAYDTAPNPVPLPPADGTSDGDT